MTVRKATREMTHRFWPGEIVCSPSGHEGPVKLITATHVYFGKSGPGWKGTWRYSPEKLVCIVQQPEPKFLPGMLVSDWMLGKGTIIATDKRYAHVKFDPDEAIWFADDGFKGSVRIGFDNLRRLRPKAKAPKPAHTCSAKCVNGHYSSMLQTNDASFLCDWFRSVGYPGCNEAVGYLVRHNAWKALDDMIDEIKGKL